MTIGIFIFSVGFSSQYWNRMMVWEGDGDKLNYQLQNCKGFCKEIFDAECTICAISNTIPSTLGQRISLAKHLGKLS
jgi:hypothetical protein